jgi:AcrR family transcriptional regulator
MHSRPAGRTAIRRAATTTEALDHAERIMLEAGAGAVTVAEVARRMGMRPPSLYKYFGSLHQIYDALFARGNQRLSEYVDDAVADLPPGLDRLLTGTRAILRWSVLNPGIAPLMFWRPVPGFRPSAESYAVAEGLVVRARDDLRAAVARGELAPWADSDETFRLLTALAAGIASQQLANEPGASYDEGSYTSLMDRALEMFVHRHAPMSSAEEHP